MSVLQFDKYDKQHSWIDNFWTTNELPWSDRYDFFEQYTIAINIALMPWHGFFMPKTVVNRAGYLYRTPYTIVFDSEEYRTWFLMRWS